MKRGNRPWSPAEGLHALEIRRLASTAKPDHRRVVAASDGKRSTATIL
jgi:hypothetical protein